MTLAELLEKCGVDVMEWTEAPEEMGYDLMFRQKDGGLAHMRMYIDEITESIVFDYRS